MSLLQSLAGHSAPFVVRSFVLVAPKTVALFSARPPVWPASV